jgi:ABC-type Fe3+-hydroxamate transport system substrate-binding protein
MRRIAILGLLATLALTASACGERSEPTGPNVKLFPVTVSANGQAITLKHRPSRIAVFTPAAVSLVHALKPTVDVLGGPLRDASGLAKYHPDVVIVSTGADLQRIAGATKAPVYVISGGSIRETEQSIVDVGALLGRPLEARKLVTHIEALRTAVERKVETLPRTSVFLDNGFFTTVPANSLAGDIISEAGGKSVAGANPGPGPFDLALLHRRNPDVYLASSDSGVTLKDLRKNPRTKGLRAVRNGHFRLVPALFLQPGPNIGYGLLAVAHALHQDAFR